jgi:signal transduction histidine kinase
MKESEALNKEIELSPINLDKEIEVKHLLEVAKKSLDAIFDGIEDWIFVINREYNIIRANKAVINISGERDFSDILGRKCFNKFYQRDRICDNCPAEKIFQDGISTQFTKICKEIDKKKVILNMSLFPIKNGDSVIQVIEHAKDVTHVVELEGQLLRSERLAGIVELATGLAHEIRNAVGTINAAAQLCLDKYELDKQISRYLNVILRSSWRINKVIKELVNLAKPHEAAFKLSHFDKIINSVCALVNARCLNQNVRLIKKLSRRLPQIFLDEKSLKEAFLNLILNAVEAMPSGGKLAITAYYDHNAEEIVTTFCDSGCGIPEDNLSRIFCPFFTTKKEGTGLGLFLTRQVIELHKGKIHIESKPDYGTEVTVRLLVYKGMVSEDEKNHDS